MVGMRMTRRLALLLSCGLVLGACTGGGEGSKPRLRLAATTSLRDSGLFDELAPLFEAEAGCVIDLIAVGTGQALRLGEQGEVDVVVVHDEAQELAFMAAGHGSRREPIMVNSFLIAGPKADPAGIRGMAPREALAALRAARATFISRGDKSGTHARELALWSEAGGLEAWEGYTESGQGQGPTMLMAHELGGYVLTDRGSWLKLRLKLDLEPLVTTGDSLRNPYAAMLVNPERHPQTQVALAGAFIDFLIAPQTQRRIAAYQLNGEALFEPLRLEAAARGD